MRLPATVFRTAGVALALVLVGCSGRPTEPRPPEGAPTTYTTEVTVDQESGTVECRVFGEPGTAARLSLTGNGAPGDLPQVDAHSAIVVTDGKARVSALPADEDLGLVVLTFKDEDVSGNYTCTAERA